VVKKSVKKEIRIYVEGAERGKEEARLREGFRKFLDELYQSARQNGFRFHPPIMCGSGSDAYMDFKKAVRRNRDALNFLLVDSQKPVSDGDGPWAHLNCDSLGLDDSNCHLMAQAMEAWLIADMEALKEVYGKGFNENALPKSPVEHIAVKDLIDSLKKATANTQKGKYHKTRHAPEILKKLNVTKVRQAAPYCDRLFKTLAEKLGAGS
jgi:Domain of unknown function (DUF4276)